MANVKVYADRQRNRQAKNYMPPIFQYGGIKKKPKQTKSENTPPPSKKKTTQKTNSIATKHPSP
jgi:hypothetical protein